MRYEDRLSAELSAVGIRGRLRARIVAEAHDHLAEGDEERGRYFFSGAYSFFSVAWPPAICRM